MRLAVLTLLYSPQNLFITVGRRDLITKAAEQGKTGAPAGWNWLFINFPAGVITNG
jgi:hypothetical protein